MAYLRDPEVNWPDLRAWEARREAHVDALVLGGDLAVGVCMKRAAAGDPGDAYAAVCVLCRHNRKDSVFAVLGAVDTANDELVRAVALALCHEAPSAWRDDLAGALQNETRLAPLLGLVMGYRRIPAEDLLRRTLTQDLPVGRSTLAWALGRVGTPASVPALSSVLDGNDEALSEAAAIALMRVKARTPLAVALDAAESRAWAKRVLAIGGNNRVVRVLLNLVRNGQADANAVLALGLLGDLSAVAPLLDLLENDALVDPAATALNVITGARLHSKVFVPDTFDPDEFFGRERAAYEKDGTLPTRHGQPFGNW